MKLYFFLPLFFLAPTVGRGADTVYQNQILPFLKSHCVACHKARKAKAELSFDKYTDDASVLNDRKTWEAVRQIRANVTCGTPSGSEGE